MIIYVAKKGKGKSKSLERIDSILTKYFEMKLFSVLEIESFESEKSELYLLAREINKTIGVYYESLDGEVENYILRWLNLGFDKDVLLEIAFYCFKKSIRTLEGMDKTIAKFYKLGILTKEALMQFMNEVVSTDGQIKKVLEEAGVSRNVNFIDRENFKTWKESWRLGEDVIFYAASISKGKQNPIKYLSRVLADWHEKGIRTVEEAKKTSCPAEKIGTKCENFSGRSYSKEEINALFQSIDEIDV